MTLNDEIRAYINKAGGTIFTVNFVKKNGEKRKMNCRLHVRSKLKGGESTLKDKENLMVVFDMQAGAYRCINLDTVLDATVKGEYVWFRKQEELV